VLRHRESQKHISRDPYTLLCDVTCSCVVQQRYMRGHEGNTSTVLLHGACARTRPPGPPTSNAPSISVTIFFIFLDFAYQLTNYDPFKKNLALDSYFSHSYYIVYLGFTTFHIVFAWCWVDICTLGKVAVLTSPRQANWRVGGEVTDNNRGCEDISLSR
jgi:hypothetical protein